MAERITIGLLFFVLCSGTDVGVAQTPPDSVSEFPAIEAYIHAQMEAAHIPGLQVVIRRGGHIAYEGYFGLADLAHRVPVNDSTRFQSGSIAKTATALGIALLEREGMLSWQDPLTGFFPGAPETWREITVLDLVDQTSGLQDPGLGWTADFSEDEYLATAYSKPLLFAPRRHHLYQNVNFGIAGILTGRVSGAPWQEFQRDRIFVPLGMNFTHAVTIREVVPNSARGYQWKGDQLLRAAPVFSQSVWDLASGSLWTTARDWSLLLESYIDAELFDSSYVEDVLLTTRSLESGHPVNYSVGNYVGAINGHRTLEHGGGNPGFRSFAIVYPDRQMTLVVMANLSHDLRQMAHTIAGLFDPELLVPELPTMTVANLERFEGTYHFPDWGATSFAVEEDQLILQAEWFRSPCRMVAQTTCSPDGETRIEFVLAPDGSVEGLIYYDSAYDAGWWIEPEPRH